MSWPPTDILATILLPLMGRWPHLHIDQRARGLSRATLAVGRSKRRPVQHLRLAISTAASDVRS